MENDPFALYLHKTQVAAQGVPQDAGRYAIPRDGAGDDAVLQKEKTVPQMPFYL